MISSSIARYGLCTLLVVSLASCGGNGGIGLPASSGSSDKSQPHGKTFLFTGGAQSFTVPAGVNSMTVVLRGAAGAIGCPRTGRGARVYAVIPVTPKEKLIVYVGGQGIGLTGGFNGGGSARGLHGGGGGGGGASDVRTGPGKLSDRILVAGGGGSQGGADHSTTSRQLAGCGGGGGLVGAEGQGGIAYGRNTAGFGGSGGAQNQGGAGGNGGGPSSECLEAGHVGADGALGVGGNGGKSPPGRRGGGGGAGGGGGYFGGGGGGGACTDRRVVDSSGRGNSGGGGGGGGSSHVERRATKVQYWQNWKNATGDGLVVFSWQ
ncbi:MAG: hypothetical protein WAK84_14760 [Candidatus Cybelea sp.]